MKGRKGFTLIELMVVILIVAILAAVAIPIFRGRIDAAKWSEGKAMMGTIATAIRAYCAENDTAPSGGNLGTAAVANELGFQSGDLTGAYFSAGDFSYVIDSYDPNDVTPLEFTITATKTELQPDGYTLDETGTWTSQ